ncbi:MAG: DoxX family protein [Candidatus Rokuibacteriota bacterium]
MSGLGAFEAPLLAAVRIVAGFLFACHGAQKVLGFFGGVDGQGAAAPLLSLAGVGGAIELLGGALVTVGLLSRYAAFIASGEMAAAYFMAHQPEGPLPITNGGELAALYAFVFLYLAARGPGPASLAAALGRPELG